VWGFGGEGLEGERRWDLLGVWNGLGELVEAYRIEDYTGLVEEWLLKGKQVQAREAEVEINPLCAG
jgi:hypothetical protein